MRIDFYNIKNLSLMVTLSQPQFFMLLYPQTTQISIDTIDFIPAMICYSNQNKKIDNPLINSPEEMLNHPVFMAKQQNQHQDLNHHQETGPRAKISFQNQFRSAQYEPKERRKKITKYPHQNALRNILPNIIHQIFCFLSKQKRSGEVVKRIMSRANQAQKVLFKKKRYYSYQKLIKSNSVRYLNMNSLKELSIFQEPQCQIFSHNEQATFIKINRILAKYFLQHQFEMVVLTSCRMSPETRSWNLQLRRKILNQIHQIFSGI